MENILSINLETETSPIIQEVRGRDYVEYGTADWRNLYPQFLIDLYYNSSTHAAIINATSEMIAGSDIIALEDDNLEAYVGLKKFLANANGNETLHEVITKVAFDFKLQGGYALNIIWSQDRQTISEIYHVPVERVRAGRPNELGKIDTYFVSADWSNIRENEPQPVAAFNVNDRSTPSQLLYTGSYSPNMDVYHTPDYLAANNWALVDQRVAEFHLANIQNGFSGSYFINFSNGVPTREERLQVERSIEEKFTGAKASGKFVLTFSDSRDNTPEITPIAVSNADKQYLALQELLMQNILTGHRCTSPMLVGINSENGFGSNAEELNSAFEIYINTVVKPFQTNILKTLSKILIVNGINLPLEFVQSKPITTMFSVEDMKEVMTVQEIRKEMGLPELTEEVVVEEKEMLSSEKTELESFIEEFGEDIPEDWEMIDEEIVDEEHQDFDYEKELNEIAGEKLELASTGRANPNTRDKQDGLNKKGNAFFKVRYVYTKNNSLSQKGETREFCKLMMKAKKVYRKQDIINMGSKPVNKGWGPRGAATYSIWLWKGGGNCHHYWKRQIWQAPASDEGFVVYPDNITTNEIITVAKARKEGFTIEKNDSLVARAPKTMTNQGFLN